MGLARALKQYDKELFIERNYLGIPQVLRRNYQIKTYLVEGQIYHVPEYAPDVVFALTDDWSGRGTPVEWGIEPVLQKLKSIDCHRSRAHLEEMEQQLERRKEEKERNLKNLTEDMARELRAPLKKFADDTLVHGLSNYDRRRVDERKKQWA